MSRADWKRPPLERIEDGKRRIRMTVAYDGAAFSGWQRQSNALSAEEILEETLLKMLGERVVVEGSGRTDAGVHAMGQVCHFDTSNKSVAGEKFKIALNSNLPDTIRILESAETDWTFHARFTAMAREYRYFIKKASDFLPFDRGRLWKVSSLPSLSLLNSYANLLRGTHDFTTFTASGDTSGSRVRDIYKAEWVDEGNSALSFRITGNAFLYRMVRSLAGTMVDAASLGETGEEFKARLDSRDRSKALRTAPSEGLYLWRISYDGNEFPDSLLEEDE